MGEEDRRQEWNGLKVLTADARRWPQIPGRIRRDAESETRGERVARSPLCQIESAFIGVDLRSNFSRLSSEWLCGLKWNSEFRIQEGNNRRFNRGFTQMAADPRKDLARRPRRPPGRACCPLPGYGPGVES